MPELIVLCAGAAPEREPDSSFEPSPTLGTRHEQVRALLRASRLQEWMRPARVDRDDAVTPAPPELAHEAWWRELFGVSDTDCIEAFSAAGLGRTGTVWRATPAHVRVGMDRMVLEDPVQLELSPDEADALADAARPLLAERGVQLTVTDPLHWHLHGTLADRLQTRSWTYASGRNIDRHLPTGEDARAWRRLLTEIQMTWHTHAVNEARDARGRPAVNFLWLDGAVHWPAAGQAVRPPGAVLSSDPALAGLAQARGLPLQIPSGDAAQAADLRAALARAGEAPVLVDLPFWKLPQRVGDDALWVEAWQRGLAWFDETLHPVAADLGRDPIRLVFTGETRRLECLRAGKLPWWRRGGTLRLHARILP